MKQIQSFIKNHKAALGSVAFALFASYLLLPHYFDVSYFALPNTGDSWRSLDPSWLLTLGKVNVDKLNWGDDFVFTYGPLSYLTLRTGWGINKYFLLAHDLFVWFNYACIIFLVFYRSSNKWLVVFLVLSFCFIADTHTILPLFAFLMFWAIESFEKPSLFNNLMQIILVTLLFFIKFNTGLICIAVFVVTLIFRIIFKKEKLLVTSGYLVFLIIAMGCLSFPLRVSLPQYIKGGLEIVQGYNQIMYLNENYPYELFFAVVVIALALIFLGIKLFQEKNLIPRNLLVLFLFSSSVYILYKQGFTRMDIQHIMEFYSFILLFMLCAQSFLNHPTNGLKMNLLVPAIFICIFFSKKRSDDLFRLDSRFFKTDYLSRFKNFNDTSQIFIYDAPNKLPDRVLNTVGKKTVDAYPWNTQLLFENRLNYSPRPVFQSYTAYTPYLENLNYEFYGTDKAPDFVFYDFDAIDQRYPLFDESLLNLRILNEYSCVDTFRFASRLNLLLKKKEGSRAKTNLVKVREYKATIFDIMPLEKDRYYKLRLSNSISGSFYSLFVHSPEINVFFHTADNQWRKFRSSIKLLETGVFGDYFFGTTEDVYHYLKGDSINVGNKIISFRLSMPQGGLFNKDMTVEEYKIAAQ